MDSADREEPLISLRGGPGLDDVVVVEQVDMFRAELMNSGTLWMCYLKGTGVDTTALHSRFGREETSLTSLWWTTRREGSLSLRDRIAGMCGRCRASVAGRFRNAERSTDLVFKRSVVAHTELADGRHWGLQLHGSGSAACRGEAPHGQAMP